MRIQKAKIKSILILLAYASLMWLAWYFLASYVADKEIIRNIISRFGLLSPLIFIFLQFVGVVFLPIYNMPIHLAGGFIFGPYQGWLLNYISTVLSLFFIVWLVKRFGRSLAERLIPQKTLQKYDNFSERVGGLGLFLVYVLPFFPDDELTYLAAASSIPKKQIIVAILLGTIPKAAFSFIGDNPTKGVIPFVIIRVVVAILGVTYFLRVRHIGKIKKMFDRLLKR